MLYINEYEVFWRIDEGGKQGKREGKNKETSPTDA